ncbi:MAG: sigma-70 family RNA polymerase sigma factor [Bryobacterales bacterium]|nr:sigma-70 family RNA polymerase sigma factor [Bryobacterales bacterium]
MKKRRENEILLARRLRDGESGLFDQFASSIGTRLLHYGLMICRRRDDAEDIVQDTLIEAYQRFPELRAPEKVHAWFFRIARNACLMRRRSHAHRAALPIECALEAMDPGSFPEAEMLRREDAKALGLALEALPEDQRMLIMMRYFEGLSTEEAAEVLEMTPDAVKTKLYRIRGAMRKKLQAGAITG